MLQTKLKTTSEEVVFSGGDGEDRTLDLLNAIQALSQLSYAPISNLINSSHATQALLLPDYNIIFTLKLQVLILKISEEMHKALLRTSIYLKTETIIPMKLTNNAEI